MTARLYLAPDGYGDMTIWRDTGHDRDEAVLTRTGGNAAGFDALAGLVRAAEEVRQAPSLAWTCEAHNVTTTGDCPACDDELIALTDGATR